LKHLPKCLGDAFQEVMGSGDLTCLREELALITSQISNCLDQLACNDTGPTWDSLLAALDALHGARGIALSLAIRNLDTLIRSGAARALTHQSLWSELRTLINDKVRAASAEAKRISDLQGTVKVEEALLFARAFLSAAQQTVTDKVQLRLLQQRCLSLLPGGDGSYGGGFVNGLDLDNVNGHTGHDTSPKTPDPPPDTPPAPGHSSPGETNPAADPPGAGYPAPAPPTGGLDSKPDPDPIYGLKEIPAGEDPADWEYIPDTDTSDGG
jgi:hypothetical protein